MHKLRLNKYRITEQLLSTEHRNPGFLTRRIVLRFLEVFPSVSLHRTIQIVQRYFHPEQEGIAVANDVFPNNDVKRKTNHGNHNHYLSYRSGSSVPDNFFSSFPKFNSTNFLWRSLEPESRNIQSQLESKSTTFRDNSSPK